MRREHEWIREREDEWIRERERDRETDREREREREAGRGWLIRNKVCSDVFARAHTHTH